MIYYSFFEQTFVWVLRSTLCLFCWLFSKLLRPKVLYFLLVISLFLKVYIFLQVLQHVILPGASYGVLWLHSSCKKKLVTINKYSNLDRTMLKKFWFQISPIIYRQQPVFLCLTYLLTVTVSVTVTVTVSVNVLYDTDFSSTWILLYFWYITSIMFTDKKAVLFLVITSMVPFRGCM